jgi:hypothetical protein
MTMSDDYFPSQYLLSCSLISITLKAALTKIAASWGPFGRASAVAKTAAAVAVAK